MDQYNPPGSKWSRFSEGASGSASGCASMPRSQRPPERHPEKISEGRNPTGRTRMTRRRGVPGPSNVRRRLRWGKGFGAVPVRYHPAHQSGIVEGTIPIIALEAAESLGNWRRGSPSNCLPWPFVIVRHEPIKSAVILAFRQSTIRYAPLAFAHFRVH
jgi:hypothetical protein